MNPAQPVEQLLVQRLDTHGNSIHAEGTEQSGLVGRNGCRVAFHRPLQRPKQVEPLHRFQDLFPLPQVEQRRRAAAKENCVRTQIERDQFHLPDQRRNVAVDRIAAGGFGVEGAVLAFVRAERHMEVETGYGLRGTTGHPWKTIPSAPAV